jgi:tRNA-2-methylthio-N6-dimethylallyladenosine synthase
MFKYSERPNTLAAKRFEDNVPDETKSRRLTEIIQLQQQLSLESNKKDIGKTFEVLIEGYSKKSDDYLFGRNSQNKVIVFPKRKMNIGDLAKIQVSNCTSATLLGHAAQAPYTEFSRP